MFRIENVTPGIDTNTFYVITIDGSTAAWVAEKIHYRTEKNAKLIAFMEEFLHICEEKKEETGHLEAVAAIVHNLELAKKINDSPIGELICKRPIYVYGSYSLTTLFAGVNIIVLTNIINYVNHTIQSGTVDYSTRRKDAIAKMRQNWLDDMDFINNDEFHNVDNSDSCGDVANTVAKFGNRNRIGYNYYNSFNMNLFNDNVIKNQFEVLDSFIQKSEPIYFIKDGYYHNNKVTTCEPLFDYDDSNYFFDQQKETIARMEELEANNVFHLGKEGHMNWDSINKIVMKTNFGILSNDPGSGKTRPAIAVALRNVCRARKVGFCYEPGLSLYVEDMNANHEEFDEYLRINNYGRIKTTDNWRNHEKKVYIDKRQTAFVKNTATLIVVSNSIFGQWEEAILDMLEEFDFDIYMLTMKEKPRGKDVVIPDGYDIILVTDGFYNNYMTKLGQNIMFNRIIFDEPDTVIYRLGNETCQARFKWLVSSTVTTNVKSHLKGTGKVTYSRVSDIEAAGMNLGDEKLVDEVMNKINIYIPANSVDNSRWINFIEYKNFQDTLFLDTFKNAINRIDPALNEALASGNEAEISRILGVVEGRMCKLDRMYNKHLNDLTSLKSMKVIDQERVKTVTTALKELDGKLSEMIAHKADECPICLCELDLKDAILYDCCFHMLHKECTGAMNTNVRNTRCPMCRMDPAPLFNFVDTICYKRHKRANPDGGEVPEEDILESTPEKPKTAPIDPEETLKVRNDVFNHVFSKEGTKTIVYATCDESGGVVDFIKGLGHNLNILKGTVGQRKRIISEFKSGLVPILVLLNHKNVAGLNLTEATDLIVYNRTSNEILKQVVGRIDRHGLDHNVNVHLLDKFDSTLAAVKEKYGGCRITTLDAGKEGGIRFSDTGLDGV